MNKLFDDYSKIFGEPFNFGYNNYVYTKFVEPEEDVDKITCGTKDSAEYILKVPGYNKDTIKIRIKDNLLEVKGEVKNEKGDVVRNFKRETYLDENIDETKAKVKDGILTLTFFKKEEKEDEWFKVTIK